MKIEASLNFSNAECHFFLNLIFTEFNSLYENCGFFLIILQFTFSEKATKIHKIFAVNLTVSSNRQIDGENFVNFCGLLSIVGGRLGALGQPVSYLLAEVAAVDHGAP